MPQSSVLPDANVGLAAAILRFIFCLERDRHLHKCQHRGSLVLCVAYSDGREKSPCVLCPWRDMDVESRVSVSQGHGWMVMA